MPDSLLEQQPPIDDGANRLAALRAALQVGRDDLDAGRFLSFPDAASLRRYLLEQAEDVLGRPIA